MSEQKTRIAIVGYGNVGKGVHRAIFRNPDMELVGILTRKVERTRRELVKHKGSVYAYEVLDADSISEIEKLVPKTDVAILCGGSATDLPKQGPFYAMYFNTVDSFDNHDDIPKYDAMMNPNSKAHKNTSIICAAWDPGTFSLERVLGDSFFPGSKRYTFWGKGVSQGHSQAIRKVEGVLDGIQYTVPVQKALNVVRRGANPKLTTRQKHTRECYIALKPGANKEEIRKTIIEMPTYFADYDTTITIETPKQIAKRKESMPHGGFVLTSGETGEGNKALIEYSNQWQSNPEATGSILIACARACHRLNQEGSYGSKTMLDIPPAYYSPRSRDELLKDFM